MTDDRPRPQYGEYATPEQQAAAMGLTYVPPGPGSTTSEPAPGAALGAAPGSASGSTTGAPTDRPVATPAYADRQPGYANRFFTVFLLGLGALTLLGDAPLYFNFASSLRTAYASMAPSVTVPASVGATGIPILMANIVIYAATVALSVFALRRGRVSFYIPILGFVVFVLSMSIILGIMAPSFISGLSK
jgi:hypothetical protein